MYCLYSKYATKNDISKPLQEIQLRAYNDFQYSAKFISRVYRGIGHALLKPGLFQFEDFIILLLADVCIDTKQSLHYMFSVADEDCDGIINARDFHWFWTDIAKYLELKDAFVEEKDVLMQFQDMVKYSPYRDFNLSLHDLETCKMCMNLFDAMFSGQKFLMFE